jgi:hypothetical protein
MKQILIIAIGSTLFFSCKNNTQPSGQEKIVQTEKNQKKVLQSDELQLNSNEKWTVNEEMKPYVLQGEEIVNTYLQTKNNDYIYLAKQLKELNEKLIKSCTMEGSSHNELHKWLHPHLEMVAALESSSNADKAKEKVEKIANSYQTYHLYFN